MKFLRFEVRPRECFINILGVAIDITTAFRVIPGKDESPSLDTLVPGFGRCRTYPTFPTTPHPFDLLFNSWGIYVVSIVVSEKVPKCQLTSTGSKRNPKDFPFSREGLTVDHEDHPSPFPETSTSLKLTYLPHPTTVQRFIVLRSNFRIRENQVKDNKLLVSLSTLRLDNLVIFDSSFWVVSKRQTKIPLPRVPYRVKTMNDDW